MMGLKGGRKGRRVVVFKVNDSKLRIQKSSLYTAKKRSETNDGWGEA